MGTSTNPSSAVMSRIKEAKKDANGNGGPGAAALTSPLNLGSPALLSMLLGSGKGAGGKAPKGYGGIDLANDPKFLLGQQLGMAMAMKGVGMGGFGKATKGGATSMSDVEIFILANQLDARAAETFRNCSREVQTAVIDRGSLAEARNPSSAVLGRIKEAKEASQGGGWGGGWGKPY